MSAVAAHAPRTQRLLRVGVTADVLALCVLAAGVAALVALTWQTWGNPGRDTGYDLVAGARVAHGELPYVDFIYYYGPLAPLSVGLFAWIGGGVMGPAVVLGVLLAAAAVLLTYALARVFVTPGVAVLAALIAAAAAFAPTNYSFVMPHTFAAPLGIVGLLGFALAAVRYSDTGARSRLVIAGLCLAVVLLSRPEFALAGVAGAAVWLLARNRSGSSRRFEVPLFALPALGLPLIVYGAFAAATSPRVLVYDNLYPRAQLKAGADAVLRAHAPLTVSSFADLAGKTVLYALGAAFLVAAGRLAANRRNLRVALGPVGMLVVAVALVRSEATRHGLEYVYGWIPAGAAVAALFFTWRALRGRATDITTQASILVAVPLALLAAKEYASFLVDAPHPQPAVYVLPLAGLFLVVLHARLAGEHVWAKRLAVAWLAFVAAVTMGLALKDARAESLVIRGPAGSVRAVPSDGAVFQRAVDEVVARSKPGEAILVAPQLTWLYAVADRRDPLPQLSLLPSALPTVAAQKRAIAALNAAGVKLVVIDLRQFPEYGHTSFGGSFDTVLAGWLQLNFHRVTAITSPGSAHAIDIWERSGP